MLLLLSSVYLFFLCPKFLSDAQPVCGHGWIQGTTSCYLFVMKLRTWDDARKDCQSMGGDLALVNPATEMGKLYRQRQAKYFYAWIGLRRDVEDNTKWRWINGSLFSSTDKLWKGGEPNNKNGNESCGDYSYAGINDNICTNTFYYICEKSPVCANVDECTNSGALCGNGTCVNTPCGFTCLCNAGYQTGEDGISCVDTDECAVHAPHICHPGRCHNVPRKYFCTCPSGFTESANQEQCNSAASSSPVVGVDEADDKNDWFVPFVAVIITAGLLLTTVGVVAVVWWFRKSRKTFTSSNLENIDGKESKEIAPVRLQSSFGSSLDKEQGPTERRRQPSAEAAANRGCLPPTPTENSQRPSVTSISALCSWDFNENNRTPDHGNDFYLTPVFENDQSMKADDVPGTVGVLTFENAAEQQELYATCDLDEPYVFN